ncbi:MAG: tetratricopeptide repeat protein [Planctomycetota bacterium]
MLVCRVPQLRPSSSLLGLVLLGCASVAPNPDEVRADLLPEVALNAAEQAACVELEQTAVDAVVRRRYGEARDAATAALARNPRAARARAVLGMVLLQEASQVEPVEWVKLRRGECEMRLATQLKPDDAFVGWLHAVFLAETGHMSAAALAAEQALERTADAPASERAALLGIAGTYRYELGEERAALPHLETYVLLRPDDATAHFRLGSSLLRIAQVPDGVSNQQARLQAEGAVRAFARCAELAPGDCDAALAIATAQLRAAELAKADSEVDRAETLRNQAIQHLGDVATRFEQSPEPYFRLGVLAAEEGDEAAARSFYSESLARDPSHIPSLLNMARLLSNEEPATAVELVQRALAVAPASAETVGLQASGLSAAERKALEGWLQSLLTAEIQ